MKKNKKQERLPEDETSYPFECISMDIFKSEAGEHGLAIGDRHTDYVWCRKTGDKGTGTAEEVLQFLQETLGAGIYFVKRFKTDHGSNLTGGVIETISKQLGIWQDTSSAYNPAGNLFAENIVRLTPTRVRQLQYKLSHI